MQCLKSALHTNQLKLVSGKMQTHPCRAQGSDQPGPADLARSRAGLLVTTPARNADQERTRRSRAAFLPTSPPRQSSVFGTPTAHLGKWLRGEKSLTQAALPLRCSSTQSSGKWVVWPYPAWAGNPASRIHFTRKAKGDQATSPPNFSIDSTMLRSTDLPMQRCPRSTQPHSQVSSAFSLLFSNLSPKQ